MKREYLITSLFFWKKRSLDLQKIEIKLEHFLIGFGLVTIFIMFR
jgi:hypothetical protein